MLDNNQPIPVNTMGKKNLWPHPQPGQERLSEETKLPRLLECNEAPLAPGGVVPEKTD